MNCCNANGQCDQGKDCPVRRQRIKEVNDAYANGYNDARLDDPFEEIVYTVKGLIALLAVVAALTMIAFAIWGK